MMMNNCAVGVLKVITVERVVRGTDMLDGRWMLFPPPLLERRPEQQEAREMLEFQQRR